MSYLEQEGYAAYSTDPGVYKYVHLGTAAGTNAIQQFPSLLGYVQINSLVLGTIVCYDSNGTSANVIGSVAITSVAGSAPVATQLWRTLATKNGLTVSWTAGLDLTVAYLP